MSLRGMGSNEVTVGLQFAILVFIFINTNTYCVANWVDQVSTNSIHVELFLMANNYFLCTNMSQ